MTIATKTPSDVETIERSSPPVAATNDAPARNKINGIVYPESDGKPMADNTKQFHYIVSIKSGFDGLYRDDPNVFIAGDLLWYPVEGDNKTRQAPDVMIVFGRPKGDRGSYLQWLEGGVPPQVVFEVLSPGNRMTEMEKKRRFYEQYGVEEYYQYDPDRGDLVGWIRRGQRFEVIEDMMDWQSPRTGIRFALEDGELVLFRSDGTRFETYLELLERAEQERQRAEQERQRAEQERQRAEQEYQRAERLAVRLRELGIDPDQA
jgi:Uma2 family endonuclease